MSRHILKIFLVITILAGGASIYLGWNLQNTRKTLETNLESETNIKEETLKTLANTKTTLATTETTLTTTKKNLADTSKELDTTKGSLKNQEEQTKNAEQKNAQYSKDLTEKQAVIDNAVKSLPAGMTFDQVLPKFKEFDDKFATLDQEKKVLNDQLVKLDKEKKELEEKLNKETKPSITLTGHILSVNEEWGFVVLDIGLNQGLNVGGAHEMIVYRNGSLVGKVKITKVEPSISIADVMPEWKQADIQPGDTVVLN